MEEYPIFSPELERDASSAIKQVTADEGATVPPYKLLHGFVARTPKRKRFSLDDEDLQEAQMRYCLFSEPVRVKRLTLKLAPPPAPPTRPATTPSASAAFKVVSDYGLRRKASLPDPESYKPCIARKQPRHRHTFSAVGMRDRPGMTVAERYACRREVEWKEKERKEREDKERREQEVREKREKVKQEEELAEGMEDTRRNGSRSPDREHDDYPSPCITTDHRTDPCLRKRGKGKRRRRRSDVLEEADKPRRKTRNKSLPTPETTQSPIDSPGDCTFASVEEDA